MSRILIVGASGVLGDAATRYLVTQNFAVRCFVRNKSNATDELEKAGAEIYQGDLIDPASIAGASKESDVIITAAHGMLSKGKNKSKNIDNIGHKNLIDSAVQSGVHHFIYTSVTGVSSSHPIDFFRTKYEIEQYLVSSGLNYTILRLAAFMEWHVHNLLGKSIVEKGKANILGAGNNPTNFVAVQDIAQALKVIILNEAYYKKTIHIGGPENLSRNDVAKLYGKVLNISPRVNRIPGFVLKILSILITPFHEGIGRIMKLSAYGETNDATMKSTDSIQQFGLRPTTVEEFIRKRVHHH
jgi:uncharacterized protein YbjT (DUF2867 family)